MVDVPTRQEFEVLADDLLILEARVKALENVTVPNPDPTPPPPDPEPEPFIWTPTGPDGYDPTGGYSRITRNGEVEAYAPTFVVTFDAPASGFVVVAEQHHPTPQRTVQIRTGGSLMGGQGLLPGVENKMSFDGVVEITLTTSPDSADRNVPLFRVEADQAFTVKGIPDETPIPIPPGPEPPAQTVVEFTDPPARFDDNKLYRPKIRTRVYESFDLRSSNMVTLEGVIVKGTHSSSRYAGAIHPGRNTTLRGITISESERLGIELGEHAHGVRILDSTFKNNALNVIWAHAYHRNLKTVERGHSVEIAGCEFANNNTRNEALNWDAADIKLLHTLDASVHNNRFLGGFGEAIWFDSDAQGKIRGNVIRDYMRAVHVEMCNRDLGPTTVLNNEIDNCSNDPRGWVWHAAILISGSTGVTVERNSITGSVKGKDISELGFDHSVRSPHHSEDRVHARYGETHVEWTGYNTINQPDTVLWRGGYPQWHLPGTSSYVVKELIDR